MTKKIGFDYPFRWEGGAPASASGEDLVAASLQKLNATRKGEHPYKDVGIELERFVFENASALTQAHARRSLVLAVTRHEPRAEIVTVPVRVRKTDAGTVLVVEVIWSYKGKVYSTKRDVLLEA